MLKKSNRPTPKNPAALLDLPVERVTSLCRQFRVRELSLFGSSARGKLRPNSDVDFLVEFEPDAEVGFITLFRLQRELSEVIQRKADLVPKNGLKPLLREAILAEARVIYAA